MIRVLKTLAIVLALVGSLLVSSGGAASADPYWQPVVATPSFHCTDIAHPSLYVIVSSCVVVNGTATQAVAIVGNYSSTAISLSAPHVALYVNGPITYDRNCLASTLSAGYTRACFAPTQVRPCSAVMTAWTNVIAAGHSFAIWSPDRKMCT